MNLEDIFRAFHGLNWPNDTDLSEERFNKNKLPDLIKSLDSLSDISDEKEIDVRNKLAVPFFGWGANRKNSNIINGKVKSDYFFKEDAISLLIENKIVFEKAECNIKNALVQTIEYLNLYKVVGAILLIFDDGCAKNREWNKQEERLINCLTSEYPVGLVRVRKDKRTCIWFKDKT